MSSERGPDGELSEDDRALLVALADRVAQYRMEVPAVLFLESVRPLNFVGSQALVFFEPMVQSIFNWAQYERFTRLMSDRDNLDVLSRMIEDSADRRDAEEKKKKS